MQDCGQSDFALPLNNANFNIWILESNIADRWDEFYRNNLDIL